MPQHNELAIRLHAVFHQHKEMLEKEYKHISPFTVEELNTFLDGEDGPMMTRYSSRSYQAQQLLSVIGANLVDKGKADTETYTTYKAVWQVEATYKCRYCKRTYSTKVCFRTDTCLRPRCQLQNMRDNI